MSNKVTQLLGIEKPIIQASMFYLTDAKLVAAVSNAGGFGILGMAAGQNHYEIDISKNLEMMRKEIEKTKQLTDKPFGLTINPLPVRKQSVDVTSGASHTNKTSDLDELAKLGAKDSGEKIEYVTDQDEMTNGLLDLAKEYGINALLYSGFLIPEWIEKIHKTGIKVLYRPMTPYPSLMKDAIEAGADAIIVTGFDEGGTVPAKVVGTFAAIPMVRQVSGDTPLIAAGGIVDENTVRAAFDLGADGIYAGTAFLASKEAPMAENIKQKMINTNAEDMLMFRAPNSFYRSLPGKLPNKLVEMDKAGASADEIWKAAGSYDDLRQGMLFGNLDKGIASFGLGISMIHSIDSVKDIVARMNKGILAED